MINKNIYIQLYIKRMENYAYKNIDILFIKKLHFIINHFRELNCVIFIIINRLM